MTNRIKRLSPTVACQIAAGEVIERPVSVVKELLENALDASATEISIYVEGAGVKEIRIEDNGDGIWAEDLKLAVEPHSTSKITSLNDLYETRSKGFRGEALASIASVSKLMIVSKPKPQEHAMCLRGPTNEMKIEAALRDDGSTITVNDLFYNVPVRRKFLKTEQYEWQLIETFVKRFALAAPNVQLSLYHDNRLVLEFPKANSLDEHLFRIRKIWGKGFADDAQFIDIERSGLRLWGWLGSLAEHRSQNDRLWVFLNGRIIQDKLIIHALKQIYMNALPEGRHPQCVLYLEIPNNWVDINVHPAKQEVRFEEPRLIYDFIISSLKTHWPQGMENFKLNSLQTESGNASYQFNQGVQNLFSAHQDFIICNSDYIILPVGQYVYYLVDVCKWWQYYAHKHLITQSTPWKARLLTMPFTKDIAKLHSVECGKIEEKLRNWGIDLQFWDNDRICIRSIPEILPQFNLQEWVKLFKSNITSDDITLSHILACCRFSAYDFTSHDNENILKLIMNPIDKNEIDAFAKCLDFKNCLKVFK